MKRKQIRFIGYCLIIGLIIVLTVVVSACSSKSIKTTTTTSISTSTTTVLAPVSSSTSATTSTPTPTPTTTPTPTQLSLYSPLTAQQVHALLQSDPSVVIIDTRATDEYTGVVAAGASVGHVPGAYSVPDDGNAAEQLYKFPDKTRPYICYCDTVTCSHASNVASIVVTAGYTNVTYMSDGIAGWTAQGYSLVTGG